MLDSSRSESQLWWLPRSFLVRIFRGSQKSWFYFLLPTGPPPTGPRGSQGPEEKRRAATAAGAEPARRVWAGLCSASAGSALGLGFRLGLRLGFRLGFGFGFHSQGFRLDFDLILISFDFDWILI